MNQFFSGLGFTRSQRRGLLLLILLLFLLAGGQWFLGGKKNDLPQGHPVLSVQERFGWAKKTIRPIDINLADSAAWEAMPGIGPKISARIVKYRTTIGGFRKVDDIKKVYGISDSLFEVLRPYLVLKSAPAGKGNFEQKSPVPVLDLNTATAEELDQLPGIGEVLSSRIVKFRDAKKGFTSLDDLKQVYGLSPETFEAILPYLTLSPPAVAEPAPPAFADGGPRTAPEPAPAKAIPTAKIDLNTADSATLVTIPGIGSSTAKGILGLRRRLGFFSDPDLVRYVYGVREENLQRALPYLQASPTSTANKLDLNTASAYQMERLVFLKKEEVQACLKNRMALGRFSSWQEVFEAFPDELTRQRLKYYAKF